MLQNLAHFHIVMLLNDIEYGKTKINKENNILLQQQ